MSDNYNLIFELDIKDLEDKIKTYIDSDIPILESELLREKYIEGNKKINIRNYSKVHKTSMKKIALSLDRAENKLFRHLQQYL